MRLKSSIKPTDQDSCHKIGSKSSISYYFHHDTADHERFLENKNGKTSFLRQYYTLVMRDITVALRDPALYCLQFILVLFFGFLVGAVFTNTKFVIDNNLSNESGGILWIIFMMAYMQIFKVMMHFALLSDMTQINHLQLFYIMWWQYAKLYSDMRLPPIVRTCYNTLY